MLLLQLLFIPLLLSLYSASHALTLQQQITSPPLFIENFHLHHHSDEKFQLEFQNYDSSVFASLPFFEVATKNSSHNELASNFLEEALLLLEKFDKQDKFSIVMLHKHFDLNPGEILVERKHEKGSELKPYSRDFLKNDTVLPYLFALKSESGNVVFIYPLEFSFLQTDLDGLKHQELLDELYSSDLFLNEYSELLVDYGVEEVFGLSLNHRSFSHLLGSTETSDGSNRVLTVSPGFQQQVGDCTVQVVGWSTSKTCGRFHAGCSC